MKVQSKSFASGESIWSTSVKLETDCSVIVEIQYIINLKMCVVEYFQIKSIFLLDKCVHVFEKVVLLACM